MAHGHLDWPILYYREQYKEADEEVDRENDGNTILKNGQASDGTSNIILRKAENREEWRKLVVKSPVVSQRSARLRDS